MQLERWIEKVPVVIKNIPTKVDRSGGYILETGLVDRCIFNTFESEQATEIVQI